MTTITITLSEPLDEFVADQVSEGHHVTAEEFVEHLILAELLRKNRDNIDALLLEGIQSPAKEMTSEDWDELKRRVRERAAKKDAS